MNFVDSLNMFGVPAKEIPCLTGSGAPTTSTAGAVGCLYMDTDTGEMYKCTAAASGVYTWQLFGQSMQNSVKAYGAKGDGYTDDTAAFQTALAKNRVLHVEGGTYKLSGGLTIGDNCMLELAQDTVLVFTQTEGNCITLGMLSNLKGNHATVKVPYEFSGNVLYAYSNDHTEAEQRQVPPFSRWDPMWKTGRYVTDLNICKADSRGFHYAVNPDECKGIAVYISADNTAGLSSYMWGVYFSGLRIAGAFSYGIRAKNFDDGWNHEMRVDAFIDACEIGVSLEDCRNSYISAIVQPRRAYTTSGEYVPYAKHGIQLIRSRNADLSGSRVWDWDDEKTLFTQDNEYQHISMIGDCTGTIVNDFWYHYQGDTRKRIHTDYGANLETVIILQEPITRWFKNISGAPYYSDGMADHRLITQEHLDAHFTTELVKGFTDVLPEATNMDGKVYNGIGYKHGVRLNADGTDIESKWYTTTGFIPITAGHTLHVKQMTLENADGYNRVCLYDKDKNFLAVHGIITAMKSGYHFGIAQLSDGFNMTVNDVSANANVAYIRFCVFRRNVGESPMVSIDEEIAYRIEGFLADGVKVKGENVIGNVGEITPDWVAKKTLKGGETIYIPQQSVSTTWSKLQISLQAGLEYDVYVNDVLYVCMARAQGSGVVLGNNTSLTLNDFPFCIYWAGGTATSGMFFKNSTLSSPIRIKVTDHAYYEYAPMPKEYLPAAAVTHDELNAALAMQLPYYVNISTKDGYACPTMYSMLEAVLETDRLIVAKITTETGVLFAQLVSYEISEGNPYGKIVMFALGDLTITLTPTASGYYEVTVSGE